uniref:C2H2-type domain-containing protein n=1 Tax=Strongyloides venezuelensis TaxID=75913 RepID=A0A0K0G359_STRVS
MDSGVQLEQYSNPKLKSFNSHSIKGTKITRWYCDICGKSLCSKRSHNDHMNIHKNARPFNCSNCSYSAASKNTLQRHFLRHHQSKEKWSYLCPYCPEMYVEAAGYRNHLKQKHHGYSGTFGCPFGDCKFSTMSVAHFKDHILRHNPSYFEEGASVKVDLSQVSLRLYLVDDNFGKTISGSSVVLDEVMVDDGDGIDGVSKDSSFCESKHGVLLPKFIIEKNDVNGVVSSYRQSLPLPKRILEGGIVDRLSQSPTESSPSPPVTKNFKENGIEGDDIVVEMDDCDNNKVTGNNISKKSLIPSVSDNILRTNSNSRREKRVFKTVEGFIDEDIDDGDDGAGKKLDVGDGGSPLFLQKEKAFKTNEGTYDWDLD